MMTGIYQQLFLLPQDVVKHSALKFHVLIYVGLPVVTVTPFNQSVEVSLTAKLIATVEGVGPFTYKWQRGARRNIKNAVNSTFIINNVSVKDTDYYRCYVTNSYGHSALSNRAFLQVTSELCVLMWLCMYVCIITTFCYIVNLPVITKTPMNTLLSLTSNFTNVSFICEANGALSYYWERQDGSIPASAIGVNTSSLNIISLQLNDAGYYRCVATNVSGSTQSKYAKLTLIGMYDTLLYSVSATWIISYGYNPSL